jgi:hypothetical protein
MKKSFTFCLLLVGLCGFGQIPNYYFNQYQAISCPFDPLTQLRVYKDWMMYQTLDDNWDGPIDSSICISLYYNDPDMGIDLHTVDLQRPIFLRCKFDESNKVLLYPDESYNAAAWTDYFPPPVVTMQGGTDCPGNICSGIFVGIQIPDETGTSTAMRWYTDVPSSDSTVYGFETCVPTEYFAENYLREFIIKLMPVQGTLETETLRMSYAQFDAYFFTNYVSEVIAPSFTYQDTSYEVPIYYAAEDQNGWNNEYLIRYTNHSTWPSSANPSYVEGRPEVNTTTPQTINLIVQNWESVVTQPFAFLRGALVEGSDSIRHNLNLVNYGGDICVGGIIDFVFEDNTKYIHAGGHVNMEGLNSCMMFRNGGTFEVADGTTMQFGQDGRGILALRSGGQMKLGKGSTLLFDGLLWLQGIPTAKHPDPQFYLDLKPGTSLVFGENASLYNANSTAPDVKLNVYMNGGTLDDSKLTPAARLLINRIYPKPSNHFKENVQVLQNPAHGQFQVDYISAGQEHIKVEVFDIQGRSAWSKTFEAMEGLNRFYCDFEQGAAGIYLVTVSAKIGRATTKLPKFD